MQFLTTCSLGHVHVPDAKQYRHYYDVTDEVTCDCIRGSIVLDAGLWNNDCPYKIGEPCKKCGSNYKHPKGWTMRCSICQPIQKK